jgi:F-type H+-transporting ATPase subunit gamma
VTDRLRQVKDRIGAVGQLEAVMMAMQGISAAHLRETRARLNGVRAYADIISQSIGEALAILPDTQSQETTSKPVASELLIVLSAEQGFAGAFNEDILDAVAQHTKVTADFRIIFVGTRGQMLGRERGFSSIDVIPMVTHADAVQSLAIRLADAIYLQISDGDVDRVTVIHPMPEFSGVGSIVERSLIPFDYARFPIPNKAVPPLLTIDAEQLLSHLAEQYVFAELCEALMLSHAAENDARVRAMVRARANVVRTRFDLKIEFQQLRQAQITVEISELATGRIAGRRSKADQMVD